MTIARKFVEACSSIDFEKSEDYGRALDYEVFGDLVAEARSSAVHDKMVSEQSYDSSRLLTFEDGSRLLIGNPRQAAFRGFMEEVR